MNLFFAAVAAFAVILVILIVALFVASRYQKVGPNEALIISGRGQIRLNPHRRKGTCRLSHRQRWRHDHLARA